MCRWNVSQKDCSMRSKSSRRPRAGRGRPGCPRRRRPSGRASHSKSVGVPPEGAGEGREEMPPKCAQVNTIGHGAEIARRKSLSRWHNPIFRHPLAPYERHHDGSRATLAKRRTLLVWVPNNRRLHSFTTTASPAVPSSPLSSYACFPTCVQWITGMRWRVFWLMKICPTFFGATSQKAITLHGRSVRVKAGSAN